MRVWRICKAKHAANPLGGEGARLYGGRWNHRGTRLVDTAASQSLATLECLVHIEVGDLPVDYQAIGIEIPDALPRRTLTPASLPLDWKAVPGPESLKAIGTAWVRAAAEAVLLVPSAVVHDEWIILINPDHPDAARITARPPVPFAFDTRLL